MIEKAIYSNWSKPNNDLYAGFNSDEAFANSLHLSVLYSKKWFKEIELVTDKKGKELVDKYKIPFDNVVVCLDDYNHIDKHHWAIGKIVACSLQTKPFIHIDNDVYWFKKPPKRLLEAECCFQNYESTEDHWYKYQMSVAANSSPITEIDYKIKKALNCGIIGFNRMDVLKEWLDLAFQYIDWFENTNDVKGELSSVMFEQYHIYQILKKHNYDIQVITKGWINDKIAIEYGYTHLIATSKRRPDIEKKVKKRLKKDLSYDI